MYRMGCVISICRSFEVIEETPPTQRESSGKYEQLLDSDDTSFVNVSLA